MAHTTDIAVYQKLTEIADELDDAAAQGATPGARRPCWTAARTVRGMANGGLQAHHVREAEQRLDS